MLHSCSMVWSVDVPYLNVWGNPLPIAAVLENANTTNVTSLQSVWLIEYHGSLYYLIKGNRKTIFKKNCNNPPWKCFLSKVRIWHLQVWNAVGISTTTSYVRDTVKRCSFETLLRWYMWSAQVTLLFGSIWKKLESLGLAHDHSERLAIPGDWRDMDTIISYKDNGYATTERSM